MADSTLFFLDYPISATELKSFLCRVVVSKTSPLTQFAPFSLPRIKSPNIDDTIPSILPAPSVTTSKTIIHKTAHKKRVSLTLGHLFNFHSEGQSRTLESENIKRYMLLDPEHNFQELMRNKDYSQDICALLKNVRLRHTYLVTGFLTTTKSTWKIDGSQTSKDVLWTDKSQQSTTVFAAEEQIFAVSYAAVRLSFKTLTPIIGRPKQAKACHLALEGSEINWNSGEAVEQLKVRSPKLLDLESSTNLKDKN